MLGTNVHGRPALLIVIARLLICASWLKALGFDDSDASFDEPWDEPSYFQEFEDTIAAQFVPQVAFSSCDIDWHAETVIAQHDATHELEVDTIMTDGLCSSSRADGAQVVKPYSSAWYPQVGWIPCTKDPYMSPICMSDVPSDGESSDGEVSNGESSDGECFVSGFLSYKPDYDGVHSYLYARVSVCSFVVL